MKWLFFYVWRKGWISIFVSFNSSPVTVRPINCPFWCQIYKSEHRRFCQIGLLTSESRKNCYYYTNCHLYSLDVIAYFGNSNLRTLSGVFHAALAITLEQKFLSLLLGSAHSFNIIDLISKIIDLFNLWSNASFSFWVLCECLIVPINNDSITLQENVMSKVLESTCRKLWCLSTCKKSTSSQTSFWDIAKTLQTCYFSKLGNVWSFPSKSYYPLLGSFLAYLQAKNQLHHSLFS